MPIRAFRRRSFLGAVVTAATAVAFGPTAYAGPRSRPEVRQPPADQPLLSENGWPIATQPDVGGGVWTRTISGPDLLVPLQIGSVAEVLGHVVRRYHYEVAELLDGDVLGFLSISAVGRESNHGSGTALDIRPGWYAVGTREGVPVREVETIRRIVADCRGVVAWGGEGSAFDVAHFDIAVPPGDPGLDALAAELRVVSDTPGVKPGALIAGT